MTYFRHCMVIKGYSKSAGTYQFLDLLEKYILELTGYQPGIHFEDSRFRNTWNAVFLGLIKLFLKKRLTATIMLFQTVHGGSYSAIGERDIWCKLSAILRFTFIAHLHFSTNMPYKAFEQIPHTSLNKICHIGIGFVEKHVNLIISVLRISDRIMSVLNPSNTIVHIFKGMPKKEQERSS